jgi:hypothetical protein
MSLADISRISISGLTRMRNIGLSSCLEIVTVCEKYGVVFDEEEKRVLVKEIEAKKSSKAKKHT